MLFKYFTVLVILLGIGNEEPNNWAFDTTQFDNILKKLKVVTSQALYLTIYKSYFQNNFLCF